MPDETNLLRKTLEGGFSLLLRNDIVPERWLIRRAMDKQNTVAPGRQRQTFEKGFVFSVELLSRPGYGDAGVLGERIAHDRVESCCVVIAQKNNTAPVAHKADTLVGIGAVTDNIAKADNFIDRLFVDQIQGLRERFKVGMDVGNDGESHD